MFNPTVNTDEKLMHFANRLYLLQVQRNSVKGRDVLSLFAPERPVMVGIPPLWLEHNAFKDTYDEILRTYFKYESEKVDQKALKKHYPEYNDLKEGGEFLHSIGSRGKPGMAYVRLEAYNHIYRDADVSYTELNKVKDSILAERNKLFKSKTKLSELSEQHKQLRRSISAPCEKLPKAALDKVFLKTFAYRSSPIFNDVNVNMYKYLLLCNVGWIKLPPFFFNNSLYDLKNKDYQKYNVSGYINLLPEASLAIVTKELQADSGTAFFKKGVKESDVLRELKKQAEFERKFAEKFDLSFACSLLNDKLKSFTPDPNKTNQDVTVKLPYMGLDRLNDEQLADVARQIFKYYSLFEQYQKYENWFENYPMAKYNRAVGGNNAMTMEEWNREAAAILPCGARDLPYFDKYLQALDTNRFHTYYDLCNYIRELKETEELRRNIKRIANAQETLVKQNSAIIYNQNMLYAQNERHHKEAMAEAIASHNRIINKLNDVQHSIDSLHDDIFIYW